MDDASDPALVMKDSIAYLRGGGAYKEIVVFIYDALASLQEHDMTAYTLWVWTL